MTSEKSFIYIFQFVFRPFYAFHFKKWISSIISCITVSISIFINSYIYFCFIAIKIRLCYFWFSYLLYISIQLYTTLIWCLRIVNCTELMYSFANMCIWDAHACACLCICFFHSPSLLHNLTNSWYLKCIQSDCKFAIINISYAQFNMSYCQVNQHQINSTTNTKLNRNHTHTYIHTHLHVFNTIKINNFNKWISCYFCSCSFDICVYTD